ncbi:AMIN-like domain-containing (lipo)protein [Nocardia otitidiscaviarum]|uniref:AMIN-like domain-containing (lipo)protein n=1 Tax=Nocardia otitidiscaviarum TaxID=1823 RepID=UPI0024582BB0|nr:hypothetical protein [Nocardia otitidiscaviarum]
MRRPAVLLSVIALLSGLLLIAPRASAEPYCGIYWGSLDKSGTRWGYTELTNIRSGRHDCFDRLVVDLNRSPAGYTVRYVDQVREDGSGHPVPLRGGAYLSVLVHAPAYDSEFRPTYPPPADRTNLVDVRGYSTFRQVAWAGSFEGQTTIGLGVRARLPFRVFTLESPGRVVIDVAHRW